ncbi:ankyrin 2,3/unc44 [Cordyceps fumosorosea ARSEF 2679]|uniref:Ankyrin 2,3/unc44 n=1 Tax=Cordyceps fumosorosea (strain ARSEF 2679) TaxID=1081104 RepID=A0A168EUB0_CORFA|nr:ankyrin 2,3/unc44 [Cordyceps fumosorosea ARSEF 2679]OAA74235.1 ankyrin 2,3/unc44 [Cordyceps fumosorosea ARSEF 2679]
MHGDSEEITAENVLQWEEPRLVDFLRGCRRREDGELDVSRVQRLADSLPVREQEEFNLKMRSALAEAIARPFDPDDLVKRLEEVPGAPEDRKRIFEASLIKGFSRPMTRSLTHLNNIPYEELCFNKLLDTHGLPAMSPDDLAGSAPQEERAGQIAMWVEGYAGPLAKGDLPPLYSGQLRHWMEFQHKWQWDNRGKHDSEEGFNEHVAWKVKKLRFDRDYEHGPHDPEWLAREKRMWNLARGKIHIEGRFGQDFDAYSSAVRARLAHHACFEPSIRLHENPREQDARTTWAEYLCYLYYWQDRYADIAARQEKEHERLWLKLDRLSAEWEVEERFASFAAVTLGKAKGDLVAKTTSVRDFINGTARYRETRKLLERARWRAEWARAPFKAMTTPTAREEAAEGAVATEPMAAKEEEPRKDGKRKRGGEEEERGEEKEEETRPAMKRRKRRATPGPANGTESAEPRRSARVVEAKEKKATGSAKAEHKNTEKEASKWKEKGCIKGKAKTKKRARNK